jgi:hypothetical protein
MSWILVPLLALAFLSIILVAAGLRRRARRVSPAVRGRLRAQWEACTAIPDPARKVLESEKVFDALLTVLGYTGSFGEKLKQAGPRFINEEMLWQAHKLRNRIAHEVGYVPAETESRQAVAAFASALQSFLR